MKEIVCLGLMFILYDGFNCNDGEPITLPVYIGIGHRIGWLLWAKDVGKEKVQTRIFGVDLGYFGMLIQDKSAYPLIY